MQTSFNKNYRSVVVKFCANNSERELAEWDFQFVVWTFVFDIALFFTTNFQLITDVYNHSFWCRSKEQRYFLNDLRNCSESFAVSKLIVGLFNICALNIITVRKPETQFWCEFAAEWLFQNILLLANVKSTLDCCHCAVRARLRRQYPTSVMFGFFNSKLLTSISWTRSIFSESLTCVDA